MINNNNTVIITTTIPNEPIPEKRRNNLINNFSKYNIPIVFNDYVRKNKSIQEISCEMIVNSLELYKKMDIEHAIICDDDFFPIDNFLDELNKTIELLPENWRSLHLCPAYLWGRIHRDKEKIGKLNAEYNMDDIPFHSSGRFYLDCDSDLYYEKKFWLGGPVCILVNKKSVDSVLDDFIKANNENPENDDVIFTRILNNNDFICREPMLGYEEEGGGTTFPGRGWTTVATGYNY